MGASASEGKEMTHGLVLAFEGKILWVKDPAMQKTRWAVWVKQGKIVISASELRLHTS